MRVLTTGGNGFVGRNLRQHLAERGDVDVACFTREDDPRDLARMLADVDFVFHLAGVNRPDDPAEFVSGNVGLTQLLCDSVAAFTQRTGKKIPVLYTSSIQAERDNPYGRSKRDAEGLLRNLAERHAIPVHLFRLPNVFGKWCRPNYNSAVATFCHNIARDLPIQVNDPDAQVRLVYVDDVVGCFLRVLDGADVALDGEGFVFVDPEYAITVGELADTLRSFRASRSSLMTAKVGTGLVRALYATYVSYLPTEEFKYSLPQHSDPRGVFVEMLKTPDCGQFSFFTAHPGITRGGHYHHTKTEKFLVIKGQAKFKFRHMVTGEYYEVTTSGANAEVVETIPGWAHDITNIGDDELVVMLWANEVFDRERPDTYAASL